MLFFYVTLSTPTNPIWHTCGHDRPNLDPPPETIDAQSPLWTALNGNYYNNNHNAENPLNRAYNDGQHQTLDNGGWLNNDNDDFDRQQSNVVVGSSKLDDTFDPTRDYYADSRFPGLPRVAKGKYIYRPCAVRVCVCFENWHTTSIMVKR